MDMEFIINVLTSDAVIAILAAFIGTYFGATTAQNIAQNSKKKEDRLNEIRHVNAALTLAFCICNNLINLKSQHVQRIKTEYDSLRSEWLAYLESIANGSTASFIRKMDYPILSELNIPNEALEKSALEKITLSKRPLAAVLFTINSGIELNQVIKLRNEYLEQRKRNPPVGRAAFDTCFGTSIDGKNVDTTYKDLTAALASKIDEAIFFSHLLCKDLVEIGLQLKTAYASEFKEDVKVGTINFTVPLNAGLIPPDDEFRAWLNGFKDA